MKVKICGITSLTEALIAIQSGTWALGFNFYLSSPRYLSHQQAKDIIHQLPSNILKIGIFVDESSEEIDKLMDFIGLDLAQIYKNFEENKVLKHRRIYCLQPSDIKDIPDDYFLRDYAYILIDAPRGKNNPLYGGTGQKANWEIAQYVASKYRIILAGGLNLDNVQQAINIVRPYAVDVVSGVEKSQGIKDLKLMQQFINKVRYEK